VKNLQFFRGLGKGEGCQHKEEYGEDLVH